MGDRVEKKDHDSKKIFTLILLIVVFMVCTTGATYAFFAISAVNSTMTGTAATVSLNLTVEKVTPDSTAWAASTQVMVPQLDAGLGAAMNTTNKCVDGNKNVVCQVFKITITNTSSAQVKLRGRIFFTYSGTNGNFKDLYWRTVTDANTLGTNTVFKASTSENTVSTTADAVNASLIENLTLAKTKGTSTYTSTYYVVVWIRETNTVQNGTTTSANYDQGTWRMTVAFKDQVNPTKGVTSTITSSVL